MPNLKEVRLMRLLTQVELAERAGLSETTIVKLERGQQTARISTVRKLAAALNVEPAALLGDRRPQPPAEGE